MKNCYSFYLGVLLLLNTNIFAQAPLGIKELQENYKTYFELPREHVFLHLNKTTVVPHENLWISTYVYNPGSNLPNIRTVNLNVKIHDTRGNYVDSHTIFISGGKGSAFINLDPKKYLPGNYFLKASTAYMGNFEEDLSFVQGFTILGKDKEKEAKIQEYDLQLLPEGGSLVTGIINAVGVKLINRNGEGVKFTEARVLDSEQQEITSFNSNRFGMSKFSFTPEKGKKYFVVLRGETGNEITQEVMASQDVGFSLVSTNRDDHFQFTLRTNKNTKKQIKDRDFFIALHKDGKIKTEKFRFSENNLETNILVHKDSSFGGVNTVTVFDTELKPILERKIFNTRKIKRGRITAGKSIARMDSLYIDLTPATPLTHEASLSISVLPSETIGYNPLHNILSAFLLKPYVRGNIEEGSYYFSKGNERRKLYDLDILLLTQGWSKYNWTSPPKHYPTEKIKHETGFSIEGNFAGRRKKENMLFIRSEETGFVELVELEDNNTFKIENTFLLDSTSLSFGIIHERNDRVSKPSLTAKIFPLKNKTDHPTAYNGNFKKGIDFTVPDHFLNSSIALDTVVIDAENKEKSKRQNDPPGVGEKIEITQALADRYRLITDYLTTKGYDVVQGHGSVQVRNRLQSNFRGGTRNVFLYWNGAPMGTDHSILVGLTSSEVESIVINKLGLGLGGNGFNGAIKITTKKGGGNFKDRTETVKTIITTNGFNKNKEFYTPKYNSYSSTGFRKYGVIHWDSDLILKPDGSTNLGIFNVMEPMVNLYIEGMNAAGVLFSEVLTVSSE